MERRWLGVALCCLACRLASAGALSVTSQPVGARVRWSRVDSPYMNTAAPTPCSLDLPAGADIVLEVTAPGYLPRFVPVADGQEGLAISLTPWRPSLVGPLSRTEPKADGDRDNGEPAADGAGVYGAQHDREQHTVTWRGADGQTRVLARWAGADREADDNEAEPRVPHLPDIWSELATSPDGRWLAYSGTDDQGGFIAIRRRDGGGGREVVRYPNVVVDYACWSADGRAMWYMATAYRGHEAVRRVLHRRDLVTGADDRYIALGNGMVTLTPDGAVACFSEQGVMLYDPATRTTRQLARGWKTSHRRRALQVSPDGRYWPACARPRVATRSTQNSPPCRWSICAAGRRATWSPHRPASPGYPTAAACWSTPRCWTHAASCSPTCGCRWPASSVPHGEPMGGRCLSWVWTTTASAALPTWTWVASSCSCPAPTGPRCGRRCRPVPNGWPWPPRSPAGASRRPRACCASSPTAGPCCSRRRSRQRAD
ncbi:MAG: hypothetical protein HZB16_08240 [Armatimonadetes bacterium]|nr:hypothetical protein [Armatimonadota bacterium]